MRQTGAVAGKVIAAGVVGLVMLMLLASMWIFGWGFFQRSTADFRGETAALEQILADPDRRITAYQHFFDLCASVQGHEDAIRALETELPVAEPDRKEQIQAAVTANQAQRDRKIRQYNVDASKDYTIGQFKDANLPHQLNINSKETLCVSSS